MKIDEVLKRLDDAGRTGLDMSPGDDYAKEAARTIRRLLAGDFTPEEIQNFCHKLPDTVSAEDFAKGCMAYQTQLYGSSPVQHLLWETDMLLDMWGVKAIDNSKASRLRARIQDQIL